MPSRLKKARAFFSRIWPVQHKPGSLNHNVHDLARIGGVSMLTLPPEFAPCDLVIPTRFATTAQFLVDVGFDVPGLFRIPGSKVTTERLKAFFERQMYDLDGADDDGHDLQRRSAEVDYTIRMGLLPNQDVIPYQVHDVASCFKSFLADLDGGILGNVPLFEGLRKVICPSVPKRSSDDDDSSFEWKCIGVPRSDEEDEALNPRYIARILCSGDCSVRRNLIFAVFGLLAFFKADPRDSVILEPEAHYHSRRSVQNVIDEIRDSRYLNVLPESRMTSQSLGRIFAPILLGEALTKQIKLGSWCLLPEDGCVKPAVSVSPSKRSTSSTGFDGTPSFRIAKENVRFTTRDTRRWIHASASNQILRTRILRSPGPYVRNPMPVSTMIGDPPSSKRKRFVDTFILASRKEKRAANSVAALREHQYRVLLVAHVISEIVRNWEDVVVELKDMGMGDNDQWI